MSRELNRRIFLSRSAATAAAAAAVGALGAAPALAAPAGTAAFTTPARIPDVPVRPEALADPSEPTVAEAVTLMRHGKLTATDSCRHISIASRSSTRCTRRTTR